jgi:phosphatidylglycerol:prolipoprotein diacylglycerol transferase
LGFWLIVAGLLGARLFYVLFHLREFAAKPLKVFFYWQGGLMFQGAVLVAAATAFFLLKKRKQSFWPMADAVAPALALGQSIGRLGCYAAGCCFGRPAHHGPLTVVFPPGSAAPSGFPLYPTQLMEAFSLMAIAIFLGARLSKKPAPGRVFALYALLAGGLRALLEQFRGDFRGAPIGGQAPTFWLALGLMAFGVWGLIRYSPRTPLNFVH